MKNDLRFQKTESALRQAILKLITEKPCEQVTVTDICQEATCSRNAFYQHYETKEQLFEAIVDDDITNIQIGFSPLVRRMEDVTPELCRQYTNNILSAVYQQEEMICLLLKNSTFTFSNRLRKAVLCNGLSAYAQTSDHPINAEGMSYMIFVSSGIAGFIEYCLLEAKLPLAEAQRIGYETTFAVMLDGAKRFGTKNCANNQIAL